MVIKLPAIEIAQVVLFGWHVAFPMGGLEVLIGTLLVVMLFATVRRMTRDMREKARRVLILGSGPLAATLIEEIESAGSPRYCVAGTVDLLMPDFVSLPTCAWFDAIEPGVNGSLELAGNPNVLTRDRGTSSLAQGPSAHTCLVQVERSDVDAPRPRVYTPPPIVRQSA